MCLERAYDGMMVTGIDFGILQARRSLSVDLVGLQLELLAHIEDVVDDVDIRVLRAQEIMKCGGVGVRELLLS